MRLLTFHKILIGLALAFFLFFGLRETSKQGGSVTLGIVSLAVCAGVATYFVWVLRGGYDKKTTE
ncbi:MAG TPA: hypothetical protein VEW28_10115 [Candidatus Kapabacteria bacterium]|nr:hypothetical protein [Candidatus Kapabacteria bacterium]